MEVVESEKMNVAAVIGWPIAQSLSPAIHNAAFRHHGDNWIYMAFPVEPGDARIAVDAMRTGGLQGMNVTMPHKDAVADLVDELDESAAEIRAVNTVVCRDKNHLVGYSTDGEGLIRALRKNAGVDVAGQSVGVIGAGGAARSAIVALTKARAQVIKVVNRSIDKAEAAVSLSKVAEVGTMADLRDCDVVMNMTSVGMGTDELPMDPSLLRPEHLVVDAVYHPLETRLLKEATRVGARTLDGLWMLIHQACAAQHLWLGREPEHQVMREAAVRELKARGK